MREDPYPGFGLSVLRISKDAFLVSRIHLRLLLHSTLKLPQVMQMSSWDLFRTSSLVWRNVDDFKLPKEHARIGLGYSFLPCGTAGHASHDRHDFIQHARGNPPKKTS
jgi:hypothetical protein